MSAAEHEIEFAPDLPTLEPFRLDVRTARELCAIPDPPEGHMLAGPLVIRGARTIIVADTGHGKTTLVMQLAGAVLTGADVLGHQGAGVGPVLILDLEQGLRSIKRTLRDSGLHDRDDVLYIAAPDGLALDSDDDHRLALEQAIATHKPAVVSVDPFYKGHRGDANEERGIVDLFRYLDELRTRHGFALLLPAHPRKTPTGNGVRALTLDDIAGSGAIVRGAELVLGLERLSHGYARLRILKDRDGDLPVGEAWPLIFTRGEGYKLDPKEDVAQEDLERRIVTDSRNGAIRTVKEWATELGVREKRAKATLEALTEAGQLDLVPGQAAGRSPKAVLYGTAPEGWAQSGAVTPSLLDGTTAPTAPTSIEDVSSGRSNGTAPTPGAVRVDDDEIELAEPANRGAGS